MAVKPPQIRYVTAGKALGASIHKGWAATWNWVLSWVHHFAAGKGLKLSNPSSGRPKLDVLIRGSDGVVVKCAGDRKPYVIGLDDTLLNGMKFHFAYTVNDASNPPVVHIGDGAVQIGGYTYFAGGGNVSNMGSGTRYICAVVALGSGTVTFKAYSSTTALRTEQSDMTKYIFPLYKVDDYEVELDYRSLPNAGCWEIAESVGSGSGGSS